jgi:hypothetical protein
MMGTASRRISKVLVVKVGYACVVAAAVAAAGLMSGGARMVNRCV